MVKDLKQKLSDKIETLMSKKKSEGRQKKARESKETPPKDFPQVFTGVFPEVFGKRVGIQVQKVQKHKNTARESQATKNNFPQVFLKKKQGFFFLRFLRTKTRTRKKKCQREHKKKARECQETQKRQRVPVGRDETT